MTETPTTGTVSGQPGLRAIFPDATPEEVAAIVAAFSACAQTGAVSGEPASPALDEWVRGSRLGARRANLQRGPWRLSGRIGRRSMA